MFSLGTSCKDPFVQPAFWPRFQWQRSVRFPPPSPRPALPVPGAPNFEPQSLLTQACTPHPARRRREKAGREVGRKGLGVTRTASSGPGPSGSPTSSLKAPRHQKSLNIAPADRVTKALIGARQGGLNGFLGNVVRRGRSEFGRGVA